VNSNETPFAAAYCIDVHRNGCVLEVMIKCTELLSLRNIYFRVVAKEIRSVNESPDIIKWNSSIVISIFFTVVSHGYRKTVHTLLFKVANFAIRV
jgi:hypothetical protein